MKKKGFTLIELLVVVAIIALLISILLPSLSRARELTKRSVCASNLRGVGSGCHIYSNENYDWFPQSLYMEPQDFLPDQPYRHSVTFVGQTGAKYWERTTTTAMGTEGNYDMTPISRSLFLVVIGGQCTSKVFICPSSGETEDNMRNVGEAAPDASDPAVGEAAQPGVNRFDFRGYPNMSYAYQMPFGMMAKPRNGMDPRMPLAADKGPYFGPGLEGEAKHVPDALRSTDGERGGAPVFAATEDQELLQLPTETWRAYNSRNHNGEGQNVMAADGHVQYDRTPTTGINLDNIYTRHSGWDTLADTLQGWGIQDQEGPFANTDTLLIP